MNGNSVQCNDSEDFISSAFLSGSKSLFTLRHTSSGEGSAKGAVAQHHTGGRLSVDVPWRARCLHSVLRQGSRGRALSPGTRNAWTGVGHGRRSLASLELRAYCTGLFSRAASAARSTSVCWLKGHSEYKISAGRGRFCFSCCSFFSDVGKVYVDGIRGGSDSHWLALCDPRVGPAKRNAPPAAIQLGCDPVSTDGTRLHYLGHLNDGRWGIRTLRPLQLAAS